MSATGNILFNMAVTGSQNAAKQFNGVNKSIVGLTAAFAALSAKVAKDGLSAFTKYEAAMRNVQSVTLDTTKGFQDMDKAVLQLTNKGLRSYAHETAAALYDVRSAGIDAGESMDTLDMILKTSSATLTDQAAIAKIVTGTMNAYGSEVVNAEKISNLFVKTIQTGVTTGAEMAASFGQVVKIGASAGVEIEELTGSVALLTANFIKTPEAVTGLKSAIEALAVPTEGQIKAAKELNIELGARVLKEKGLVKMMAEIGKATGGNLELMKKLIPSTTGLTAALVLADNAGQDFSDTVDDMKDSGDALEESLKRQEASFKANVDSLNQGFNLLSIEVGRVVAEAVLPLVKGIVSLIQGFNNLHPITKRVIVTTGLVGGAVAGLTTGIIALKVAISAAGITAASFSTMLTGSLIPALGAALAPALALAGGIWAIVEAMKAKQAAEDADRANTQVIKNYESHIKAVKDLESRENLNIKQKKRLALAYRSLANEMKKGTNAHAVYVAKYKSMLASIDEADKKAAKKAKGGGVKTVNIGGAGTGGGMSTGDGSLALAEAERIKNEKVRLKEDEIKEYNRITLSSYHYQLFLIEDEYKKKVKTYEKAGLDISTIEKTYQRKKKDLWSSEYKSRKRIKQKEIDDEKKKNDKILADNEKHNEQNVENYKKAQEEKAKYNQKIQQGLVRTAAIGLEAFTDMNSQLISLGENTATSLIKNSFDPMTFAVQFAMLQIKEMGEEFTKVSEKVKKHGVETSRDVAIAANDFLNSINPIGALSRMLGIETPSLGMLSGEVKAVVESTNKTLMKVFSDIDKADKKANDEKQRQKDKNAKYDKKLIRDTTKAVNTRYKEEMKLIDSVHDKKIKNHESNLKRISKELNAEKTKAKAVQDLLEGRTQSRAEKQRIGAQFKSQVAGFKGGGLFRKSERLAEAEFTTTEQAISQGEEFGGLSFTEVQKQRKQLAVQQFAYYQNSLKTTKDIEKRAEIMSKMRDAQRLFQENAYDRDLKKAKEEDKVNVNKVKRLELEKQIEGWLLDAEKQKQEQKQKDIERDRQKQAKRAEFVAMAQREAIAATLPFGLGRSMGSNPLNVSTGGSSRTSNNSVNVNFSGAINANSESDIQRMGARLGSMVANQLRRQI
tara:strand:- start:3948 stop:7328 length:3381 start_codon:yes stop_codon:yes gene_type:complete